MKRVTIGIVLALLALLLVVQPTFGWILWDEEGGCDTVAPSTSDEAEGTGAAATVPESSDTGTVTPPATEPVEPRPSGIYQGVTKTETTTWGVDVWLSYDACQFIATASAATAIPLMPLLGLAQMNPVIGLALLAVAGTLWTLAAHYQSGIIVKMWWLWPMAPKVYRVLPQSLYG